VGPLLNDLSQYPSNRLTELPQNSYLRDGQGMGTSMGWIGLSESVLIFFIYICR